jgi:DNA polymerase
VWAPRSRLPHGAAFEVRELWPDGFGAPLPVEVWHGEDVPPVLLDAIARGFTFAAHNAMGFDAAAYEKLVGGPQPAAWYDTLPCARAAGLPGGLDELGKRFLGRGKDDLGRQALKMMYTAKYKRGADTVVYPVGSIPLWKMLLRYNVADVLLLQKVFDEVADYGEADVLEAHCNVNARGVAVDRGFLDRLSLLWQEAEANAFTRVAELTEGKLSEDNLRSNQKVRRWLESQGLSLNSLNRAELNLFYDDPEEFFGDADHDNIPRVVEVLKLRQAVVRGSPGKIKRAFELLDKDGRVRDLLVYHGAHTGRWSARGLQPHNLPRGVDIDIEAILSARGSLTLADVAAACAPGVSIDDALASLLRPAFHAPPGKRLLISDYAGIEARGIAWVAGETALLDLFRRGDDPYCAMASAIFARPITKKENPAERNIGKVVVLGCGYGMSARKFADYCKINRIDLLAAGVTGESCVKAYRHTNAAIVQVWRDYNSAAFSAVQNPGKPYYAGRCIFGMRSGSLVMRLPSGREVIYRNAKIADVVPAYCKVLGIAPTPKPTVVYTKPHGYTGSLYGGLLAENAVQSICRDLLATSLVKCERAPEPLPVVLHVHDEIVAEVDEARAAADLDRLVSIMLDTPQWADGFPVAVEAFECPRYTKKRFKSSYHVERSNAA